MTLQNIRNVRSLGENPEAYIVTVDLDFGTGAETVEYVARVGGGEFCDAVLAAIAAGQFIGEITAFVPTTFSLPEEVVAWAFIAAAKEKGWITEQERDNWLSKVSLPAIVTTVINSLPEEERAVARARALGMTRTARQSALIDAARQVLQATEQDVANLFIRAAEIEATP